MPHREGLILGQIQIPTVGSLINSPLVKCPGIARGGGMGGFEI